MAMRAVGFDLDKEERNKLIAPYVTDEDKQVRTHINYETFFELMKQLYEKEDPQAKFVNCFSIFDNSGAGKIFFTDLKRVAKELGENMTDEEIMEMIDETRERDGSSDSESKYITMDTFSKILKNTSLFKEWHAPIDETKRKFKNK